MKIIRVITLVLIAAVFFAPTGTLAQEERVKEAYGFVSAIADNTMTIEVWRYDTSAEEDSTEEVVYIVSPEVEIENAESFSEIKEGRDVDVQYVEKDGQKVINHIYVYTDDMES